MLSKVPFQWALIAVNYEIPFYETLKGTRVLRQAHNGYTNHFFLYFSAALHFRNITFHLWYSNRHFKYKIYWAVVNNFWPLGIILFLKTLKLDGIWLPWAVRQKPEITITKLNMAAGADIRWPFRVVFFSFLSLGLTICKINHDCYNVCSYVFDENSFVSEIGGTHIFVIYYTVPAEN